MLICETNKKPLCPGFYIPRSNNNNNNIHSHDCYHYPRNHSHDDDDHVDGVNQIIALNLRPAELFASKLVS